MKGKLLDLRCENEPWPLSKCKRVLRPFASKIRSFHDMAKHYPQILESSQDFGRILQLRTINRQSSSTPPSSNGARYGKGPKNRYTKSQYTIKPRSRTYEDDSDYDSGTEMQDLTFDIDSDRDDGEMVHPIQALDSYHRWKAMKPQVTEEGYQELSEIFELFKRFMSQAYTSDPARLQEHSAMKVGQCVEVTARQSMFDDENEAERDPSNHFNEADWYEHSPAMKLYTKWILLGQGLEILNSHVSDLYYVFPSLIHYCVEIKALRIAQIMASRYLSEVPSDLFWCYFVQRVGINTLHSPSEGQSSIQRNHFAELLNLAQLGYEETIISHLWNKVDFKLLWNHEPIWDEIKRIAVSQKQQHCTHLLLVVIVKNGAIVD
ncbi:hypothetical protein BABINDRAFT_10428 [Babjeviella inositovora NRRL Y-12698]|uniref:Uncharacterized protein n=1 Tax=Babjeviella inositovora NRRL Y-12698 TaxID=984486 RepID=A0A1E3QH81_9ASCO|nr:uncharacterized protein BABINDRAFT_10428 [Babjeviella inositovora NRRL Y-12698]ODQ77055.1 hypothetical protein BABINDRAFT_10428 [Babjeviella inositovora NRRL Y-12698]